MIKQNNIEKQAENFYKCFSWKQDKYLRDKGFSYILKARHTSSFRIFTVYKITDELNEALKEWTSNSWKYKKD